jgi:hypothetical protein
LLGIDCHVAPVGNLLYHGLAVGRLSEASGVCGLPIRDTADSLLVCRNLFLLRASWWG